MSIKDRGLLLKAAEGDNTAIRDLWDIWSPRLNLYYRGSLRTEDAEDLVQETMLKVFRSLKSYNPIYSPSTWIYTIAARNRTDWLRKSARQPRVHPEADEENRMNSIKGNYPDPEDSYFREESRSEVKDFLNSQDKRDKEILYLYCYEDLSGRGIARVMNLPPETVRYRLKILKKKLNKELKL
jgi:RNA polymerase sigma-70 factor, ECF subfamily